MDLSDLSRLLTAGASELPLGLCADRGDHLPHVHDSATLGRFWCTADQMSREPGRS